MSINGDNKALNLYLIDYPLIISNIYHLYIIKTNQFFNSFNK